MAGFLSRASDAIRSLLGKEVVGKDALGNVYLRWHETIKGEKVEKREVNWHAAHMLYDPCEIPPEWRMWLRKLRQQPPTPEEMSMSAEKAEVMRQKVAAIDEQERLRRLRQEAMGNQQMHPEASRAGSRAQPGSPPDQPGQPAGAPGPVGTDFKPEAWRPGS
ncbi:NADH dehydrogenase [ubiquinone] 1 alpha subcomplex subunit 12 [Haematococcus lacustris]|uniref:NADH dehydrogenase [ubiquinone] 1 alpha subcomplex subunit 12 n=1 Tax=Haematococcus lacustris TaxID=44745 RepID=A0A699ZSH8_HAELA|nr:NADH dehydrogenase [ubiquinone] 1 alpha subcomplex subunit 12 [Haematococcus lacustris]